MHKFFRSIFGSIPDDTPVEYWVIETFSFGDQTDKGNRFHVQTTTWKEYTYKKQVPYAKEYGPHNPIIVSMILRDYDFLVMTTHDKDSNLKLTQEIPVRSEAERNTWLDTVKANRQKEIEETYRENLAIRLEIISNLESLQTEARKLLDDLSLPS